MKSYALEKDFIRQNSQWIILFLRKSRMEQMPKLHKSDKRRFAWRLKGEHIGIIGAGNMGEALIRGIVRTNMPGVRLIASDKNKKRRDFIRRKYSISVTGDNLKVVAFSSIVVIAVKPRDADSLLSEIAPCINDFKTHAGSRRSLLLVSIIAGVKTKDIEDHFCYKVPTVRVMPNAPALIAEGVSAVCLGRHAKTTDYRKVESLFKAVGEVVRVEENLIDEVTAISGSGPAYFFVLIKCLTDIGIRLGLKRETAQKLVNYTAQGAGRMVIETKEKPEALIQRVASKGGTTQAALDVFNRKGWEKIVEQGVKAALKRARELGRN